jgi:F420-non-reducing hydrogenase iron-sulfur subunit
VKGITMDAKIDRGKLEPEIVVLYCQHCMGKDEDPKAALNKISGCKAEFLIMPCSSKVETSHMLKILAEGADGLLVVGCKTDRCRFLTGSAMAQKRVEYARGLLDEIQMGADRLRMERGEELSSLQMIALVQSQADAVRALGPNPMKGAKKR